MGYDQYRSGVVQQICLKPGDGVQVQVVGRLVKEQDIWFCEQKLSERYTGLLASGECGDGF